MAGAEEEKEQEGFFKCMFSELVSVTKKIQETNKLCLQTFKQA